MYIPSLVFLAIFLRLAFSLSFSTDDLIDTNDDTSLFDSVAAAGGTASLFNSDDSVLADGTSASNACLSQEDSLLPLFDDEATTSDLVARELHPACLPPVQIGGEASQLMADPLDLLETHILPLKDQLPDQNISPPYPPGYNEPGTYDPEAAAKEGWQDYLGEVTPAIPEEDSQCLLLGTVALMGLYPFEVCCDGHWAYYEPASTEEQTMLDRVDILTASNRDFMLLYACIGTFSFLSLLFPFIFHRHFFY